MTRAPWTGLPREVCEVLNTHHVSVAGDVVEITRDIWAIHGSIAVDGSVILAEFGSAEEARVALSQLSITEQRT